METAPSEAFQGAAEEIVEVNNDEKELVGYLDAPNKDTNTIVKVVVGEDVTTPSELKEDKSKLSSSSWWLGSPWISCLISKGKSQSRKLKTNLNEW